MPGMSPFKKETKSVLKKAVKNVKKKRIDFIGIDRASKTEKLAVKQDKKKNKNQKNPSDFRPDFSNNEQKRGVVYLSHIPPGFYEEQMRKYFNQFGHVLNVKLARSHKTGNSMGYGFIEFRYAEVAKVVAETMNNYVMCKRVLKAEFVERTFPDNFWRQITPETCKTVQNRRRQIENLNRQLTPEEEEVFEQKRLVQLNKILADLKAKGVEYNFQPTYGPRPKFTQKRKKWQPRPQNMTPTERYTPLGEEGMVSLPVMEIDESDPEIDFMTPPNVRKLKLRSSADVQVSPGSNKRPVTGTCPHPAFAPAMSPARSPSIRLKGAIGKRKPPKAKALKKAKAKAGVKKPNSKKTSSVTKDKLKRAIVAMGGVKNVRVKNKVEPFSSPVKAKASPKHKPQSPSKSPAGKRHVVEKRSPVKSPNSKSAVKEASEHCNKKSALKKELAKKLTKKAKAAALGKKKADLLKEKLTKKLVVKKSQAAAEKKQKQPKKKLKKSATVEEPAVKTAKSGKALLKKDAKSISPNKSTEKAVKGKKALLKKKLGSKIAAKKQAIAAKGKKISVKNVSPKKQAKDKKEIVKKVSPKKQAKDKKEIEKTVAAKKKKAGAPKDKKNPTKKAASPKTAKAAKKTAKSPAKAQAQAASGRPVAKSAKKKKKQLIKVAWKLPKK